jgi:hypothetical protein
MFLTLTVEIWVLRSLIILRIHYARSRVRAHRVDRRCFIQRQNLIAVRCRDAVSSVRARFIFLSCFYVRLKSMARVSLLFLATHTVRVLRTAQGLVLLHGH